MPRCYTDMGKGEEIIGVDEEQSEMSQGASVCFSEKETDMSCKGDILVPILDTQ